jgi:hypothetical protein
VFVDLLKKGIITREREMSLRMFLFDADVIIHESGIPPIHTSLEVLNELPASLKKKMLIVHCTQIPSSSMHSVFRLFLTLMQLLKH